MNNTTYLIYNGSLLPGEATIISPNNRSFKYGDGFFETMKMINGSLIFEEFHFERLFSSLQTLQFNTVSYFTKEFFLAEIQRVMANNNHQSLARIRLTIFRGDGNLNDDNDVPNYVIQSWALHRFPHYYKDGLRVDVYKAANKSCDRFSGIKSNNYLPYAMAAIWYKKNGFDDALILNCYNRIAEATTSNLFIVKNGLIKTPHLSEGCVAGVTRRYLLQCFKSENTTCEETVLTEQDLFDADEIFLTNTGFYIQWIERLGNKFYTNETSKDLYQRFIRPLY